MRQFVRRDRKDEEGPAYVHLKVDLEQPDKIARAENGVPVPMFEWDVVWASDQERANLAYTEHSRRLLPVPAPSDTGTGAKEDQPADANREPTQEETTWSDTTLSDTSFSGSGASIPSSQRAADYRRTLRAGLESARIALEGLTETDRTAAAGRR
ncbi:hypothetical protein ACH47Z_45705 [Streptomyces sp. NPDC020192]|uniref:hypothetical protein n=1 Tax=Streptomyces sp. NPDC020192 TaxID=3365066 RepID=UPI00378A69F6